MQATQSSTASGQDFFREVCGASTCDARDEPQPGGDAGGAEAGGDAVVEMRPAPMAGVAEGAGLAHDAGNLLGALSLYSDLLAMPGVLHEEHREYANELRMLSDRSWAMINRLVNHSRSGLPTKVQT